MTDGLPPVIGDRVLLQQVLLNLFMNAIESMNSVNVRPRVLGIRSEWLHDGERILIAVQDSGTGFDPQGAARLFDAFYTTKPQGMGMGLSICRNIVAAHGGQLSARNNPDHGASFEFSLPADAHAHAPGKVEIATA